ncbi:MAG: hypothetical protein EOP87_24555 [Verrucomicrobiaceae bacterium]|nr:MAG: hypothetical protein EOP87_24555 [Verrucomicrobiaceae bacterium]
MKLHSRLRPLVLAAACVLSFLPGMLQAQSKYYMYSKSHKSVIAGATQHERYKTLAAAEILSFSWSASNVINIGSVTGGSGAGKATFDGVRINFIGEPEMMPGLFTALVTGQHLGDLVIEEFSTEGPVDGKTVLPYLKLDMRLVMLENLEMVGTQGDRAVYSASLKFGAIEITTAKVNPSTGAMTTGAVTRWSVIKNDATLDL